jgi:hypothetical protein
VTVPSTPRKLTRDGRHGLSGSLFGRSCAICKQNNYTVGIGQHLTKNLAVEVNYVGSQGHFLPVNSGRATGSRSIRSTTTWAACSGTFSPSTLAAAQAIDPTVALPYSTLSGGFISQMLLPFPR